MTNSDDGGIVERDLTQRGRRWGVYLLGIAAVVAVVVVTLLPTIALRIALRELNEEGRKVGVEDVRRENITDGASALSTLQHVDILVRVAPDVLQTVMVEGAAATAGTLPVTLSEIKVTTGEQLVEISASVSGKIAGNIELRGKISGVLAPSFAGGSLVLRPALTHFELTDLKLPGWHWVPGSIVRLANPAIATMLTSINGALPVYTVILLPASTPATTVKVGTRNVQIPALEPRTPALMVADDGVTAIVQVLPEPGNPPIEPATAEISFENYRNRFEARTAITFPNFKEIPSGVHLADKMLDEIFGAFRAPVAFTDVARAATAANAQVLNDMRGPDVVLFISGDEAIRLIGSGIAKALKDIHDDRFKVHDVVPRLQDGLLLVEGSVDANIPPIEGQRVFTNWRLTVAAALSGEPGSRAVRVVPRVAALRLEEVNIVGNGMDALRLVSVVNNLLESLIATVNKALPTVPIDIPILATDEVELKPFSAAGTEVHVEPEKFTPPAVGFDRIVVHLSERGLWILSDISTPGLASRDTIGTAIKNPLQTSASKLEAAITTMVRQRYGDLPQEPVYGLASWRRFAEIFNVAWTALQPRGTVKLDTGTQQLPSQGINLMDYGHFTCGRDSCELAHCEQRSCQFEGCSRSGCDSSCPSISLPGVCTNNPWPLKGRTCIGGGSVEEPGCVVRRQACNSAADLAYGTCQAQANARKASCDAAAVAEKAACDTKANADVLACNAREEAKVALCNTKLVLTNGLAEISGVGAIGGDARVRVDMDVDVRALSLDPSLPGGTFAPVINGSITGNLGLDWKPYDIIGHILVCPIRGKVFVEDTLTFSNSQPAVRLALLGEGEVKADDDPATVDLGLRTAPFRVPVTLSHGLLNALYTQNPQIAVTCPVAGSLLVPGLILSGEFSAISENDIAKLLAATDTVGSVMVFASGDGNVRAGMGVLFGGSFSIPVGEQVIPFRIREQKLLLFDQQYSLRPMLKGGNFRFVARKSTP